MSRFGMMVAAAFAALSLAAAVPADAVLSDFPRRAGETDDAPRFRRAIDAAAGGLLAVPRGDYAIAAPLVVTNRCSIEMHPAACLRAVAKMDYVLTWDGWGDYHALTVFAADGTVADNLGRFIRGGEIDGNGLASCLRIGSSHHFTLADITLRNGVRTGLEVSRWNGGHLYELIANNVYCKCNLSGLAGNVGIDCQVSDCHFTDVVVVDYTTGVRVKGSSNRFTRCHVWGGTVPPKGMDLKAWSEFYGENKKKRWASLYPGGRKSVWTDEDERNLLAKGVPEMLAGSVAFDIVGGRNTFDGCYADTAEIGYWVKASATICHSGFFNNPLMGLRKSTAIVHARGRLVAGYCDFNGGAGCEKLYEATGADWREFVWEASTATGGAGMAEEARKFERK